MLFIRGDAPTVGAEEATRGFGVCSRIMRWFFCASLILSACGTADPADAGGGFDAGALDGAAPDGALLDGGGSDAATAMDAQVGLDATVGDGGGADAGIDSGTDSGVDSGTDSGVDSGIDSGTDSGIDSGIDSGVDSGIDSGVSGGCISGATGTHALRFRWAGSGSGSRAYVVYETNTLPDTSRWRVGAYSRSIGYTPVFRDPFLGEGGLELSGTVFIDVELSTAMLSRVRNATLAIYGRSYSTGSSGSFEWTSFSGSGASPRGGVANSAPYQWYPANATTALPAGDGGTLLRIEAGPPSNALIVNRVEICFDAI